MMHHHYTLVKTKKNRFSHSNDADKGSDYFIGIIQHYSDLLLCAYVILRVGL